MSKPEVRIRDFRLDPRGVFLIGFVEDHPRLGEGEIRSSRIMKVETRNTIYVLHEDPKSLGFDITKEDTKAVK
jgi:hypothetical protein